ncbi:MAG TPA: biopolymer transporter ExbD [Salinisphaeraceae bacterium]|nr:biopolymer transporter ExbD [Salinisphaeraceae bacterium]
MPPPKRQRSLDDSILPLINVVFLLLIFFVVAGVIARQAPFDIILPQTMRTETRSVPAEQILAIAADGRLAFAGEPIASAELDDILATWPEGEALQIQADSDLPARQLNPLLERLRRAGIVEVRLLTQHQSR